ncbi:MAG TPA: hypothetical protein VMD05_00170 [Candidatus Nanoarchaeia archaeon]|nr:hypothetical protein [Candidatus Nanoarchaeia archaeon]
MFSSIAHIDEKQLRTPKNLPKPNQSCLARIDPVGSMVDNRGQTALTKTNPLQTPNT